MYYNVVHVPSFSSIQWIMTMTVIVNGLGESIRVCVSQGRRANKKAVKEEYNRLSDPGYAAKMRAREKEEVRISSFASATIRVPDARKKTAW